jgi:hypothetical protein
MKQFKSAGQAQRFLSAHDRSTTSSISAAITSQSFRVWAEISGVATMM